MDIWIDRVQEEQKNGCIDEYTDRQSLGRNRKMVEQMDIRIDRVEEEQINGWIDVWLDGWIGRFQEGEIVGQMDSRQIYQKSCLDR